MKMKKTWLSYLLWLLFAAEALVLSAAYLSAAGADWGKNGGYTSVCLIFIVFTAAAGIWFLGSRMAEVWTEKVCWDAHSKKMLECFLAMGLFAASVLVRIQMLKQLDMPEGSVYFDMAMIKSTGGVPAIAHGASYCYTVILSGVLAFFGNKVIAGVFLQVFFQLLTLLLLYFGVKALAGRTEALCTMAVMAFLPAYAGQIYSLTPEIFYFFLYSSGIFAVSLCRKAGGQNGKERERGKAVYAAFLLAGIYIGIMGYLDIIGFTLLFFAGGICMEKAAGKNKKTGRPAGYKFLFCLLGALTGISGCMAMDTALSGGSLSWTWAAWMRAAAWGGSFRLSAGPDGNPAAGTVLCLFGLLGGIGFWFHKEQKQDMWILYLLAATALDMVSAGTFTYTVFIAFGWAVLAGIGINSMRKHGKSKKTLKVTVPDIVLEDMDRLADEEEKEKEEADGKPKVQLIENPLPLPKKHVRREMDYDRIVESDKMKFDIEVDEADDFDI